MDSKKLTRDGKSVKATDLFDSALFMSVEPLPEILKLDINPANPLPENPASNGNRLKSQFSILESCRNPFDSQWSTPSELPAQNTAEVETSLLLSNLPSNTHNPPKTGAGLQNLGNACYLNAVLQCFIHTVPFVHGILSDTHSVQCKGNKEGFCLRCTLHELVKLSFTSSNRVISPWKLVKNLRYFSSFQGSQQEDAHEFLHTLLSSLDSSYEPMGKDNVSDNFVKQVFGGRILSKVKCCKCGYISDTLEPAVDLSLEIGDADNLKTALQSFTNVEKIEDSEAIFTCQECKDKVFIEKQLAFDQVPSVAVFHLKRFKTNGHLIQKIDKHVAFPLELDLLPFTSRGKTNDMEELKYVLHAVVVHVGSFSYGHYYCFIRLSPDTWCKFDDSNVVGVGEDDVLSQKAYILFYEKEGTTWFSSFIENQNINTQTPPTPTPTSGAKKRRVEKDFDDLEDSGCSLREKKVNVPCSRDEQLLLGEECFSRKKSRSFDHHHQSSIVASVLHPWIARTFRYS